MKATQAYLEDARVALLPLSAAHATPLWPIAQQLDVHRYGPSDISNPKKLEGYIATALDQAAQGKAIPFAVLDKTSGELVGCTRYGHIDSINGLVHIGWTWIAPKVQRTGLNHRMKFLMLRHAFETMDFHKVVFRIDALNMRSRKAVEKLGAQLEGILREDVVVKEGRRRDSCCYGILRQEWPTIKAEYFGQMNA